jgi:predicted LPLAT superfamily acyltransferase
MEEIMITLQFTNHEFQKLILGDKQFVTISPELAEQLQNQPIKGWFVIEKVSDTQYKLWNFADYQTMRQQQPNPELEKAKADYNQRLEKFYRILEKTGKGKDKEFVRNLKQALEIL